MKRSKTHPISSTFEIESALFPFGIDGGYLLSSRWKCTISILKQKSYFLGDMFNAWVLEYICL